MRGTGVGLVDSPGDRLVTHLVRLADQAREHLVTWLVTGLVAHLVRAW
jgi:hypothetical protein